MLEEHARIGRKFKIHNICLFLRDILLPLIIAGPLGTYLIRNSELNSDTGNKSSQVRFDKGQ